METTLVLMAGGKGLRLHPLTQHTPKPMIKVGSKPILEQIIDDAISQGVRKFILCVHYKSELIEGYFGDGSNKGVEISYVHEAEPMGTAGALSFLPRMNGPFIVRNADIIADIDYQDLMRSHREHGMPATMCLALYQHQVPFGVAETSGSKIVDVREKPIECFQVNAGIYVLPSNAKSFLSGGYCDMPDLLKDIGAGSYPITGFWCDVGRFESLAAAHIDWSLRLKAAS